MFTNFTIKNFLEHIFDVLYSHQVDVGMRHTLASVVQVNMEPFCTMAML